MRKTSKTLLKNTEVDFFNFKHFIYLFIETQREREAETQAEGEAGSMHREPNVGFDPRSPGLRPGPKAGAKPLRHPGIPKSFNLNCSSLGFLFSALSFIASYGQTAH